MIQLNLLPDVKLQYIKARRDKRTIILIATLVIAISVGVSAAMISFVYVAQKQHIKHLDNDIDSGISEIQNTKGIDEILTIQNQLGVVNDKHQEKPDITRVLPFVAQMLPDGAKLTQISIDYVGSTLKIDGTTTDINTTNKLVDTLKFAKYKATTLNDDDTKGDSKDGTPFSEVVLASYADKEGKSTYSIAMKFDPIIFTNTEQVALSIPGIVSTRSSTEKPNISFDKKAEPTTEGQQ